MSNFLKSTRALGDADLVSIRQDGQLVHMTAADAKAYWGGGGSGNTTNMQYLQDNTGWATTQSVAGDQILTSFVIPAGMMLAQSRMEILTEWSISGTSATKAMKIVDASSGLVLLNIAGAFGGSGFAGEYVIVANRNSQTSQFIRNATLAPFGTGGSNGIAPILGTLDFTVARTFNLIGNNAASTETVKLENYQVRVWV